MSIRTTVPSPCSQNTCSESCTAPVVAASCKAAKGIKEVGEARAVWNTAVRLASNCGKTSNTLRLSFVDAADTADAQAQ